MCTVNAKTQPHAKVRSKIPMETLFFAIIMLLLICVGLGVGVLFFGKTAQRDACGSVPHAAHEDCPSQKAGLCPIEDLSGALKIAKLSKISYDSH
jgi:hypothetical protein